MFRVKIDDDDLPATIKSSSVESVHQQSLSSASTPTQGGPGTPVQLRTASIKSRPTSSRITAAELVELFQRQSGKCFDPLFLIFHSKLHDFSFIFDLKRKQKRRRNWWKSLLDHDVQFPVPIEYGHPAIITAKRTNCLCKCCRHETKEKQNGNITNGQTMFNTMC